MKSFKLKIVTSSEARSNLKDIMDQVCKDKQPIVITGPKGRAVVLMSLDQYVKQQNTLKEDGEFIEQAVDKFLEESVVSRLPSPNTKENDWSKNG